MNIKISIFIAVCSLGILSCYKTPSYPSEPHIDFAGFTVSDPYTITDTGNLRISFTDGDGDIGRLNNSDPTLSQIFISSTKYSAIRDTFNIPIIPAKGTTKAISGTIDIKLAGTGGVGMFDESYCLLLHHPLDTLSFEIYILDRAGHKSNVITTPALLVQCP